MSGRTRVVQANEAILRAVSIWPLSARVIYKVWMGNLLCAKEKEMTTDGGKSGISTVITDRDASSMGPHATIAPICARCRTMQVWRASARCEQGAVSPVVQKVLQALELRVLRVRGPVLPEGLRRTSVRPGLLQPLSGWAERGMLRRTARLYPPAPLRMGGARHVPACCTALSSPGRRNGACQRSNTSTFSSGQTNRPRRALSAALPSR